MIACIAGVETTDEGVPEVIQAELLRIVPRIRIDRAVIWVDIRGLPMPATVQQLRDVFTSQRDVLQGSTPTIGIARLPSVAEVAARHGASRQSPVFSVRPGTERVFLAPLLIDVLHPDPPLANLLDGAGIEYCRDLARLSRESVEVRFGAAGARIWQLARGDDRTLVFDAIPRSKPHASLEWTDYAIKRVERLVFVLNALCGTVCQALRERGEGAVQFTMQFSLANRATYDHILRAARPTADQTVWMRLIRLELEQIVLPDAVSGITLTATVSGALGNRQGDLFDRGFSTAPAAEAAITHILDDHGAMVVTPRITHHHLLDRQTTWVEADASLLSTSPSKTSLAKTPSVASFQPVLTLQLLPTPVRITVIAVSRHGDDVPRVYRDSDGMHSVVDVAGPDRVSGEWWDRTYARDYFRCVTEEGRLVWMYRDLRSGRWYLHGWWD